MASILALALAIPAMAADTDNDGLEDSILTFTKPLLMSI